MAMSDVMIPFNIPNHNLHTHKHIFVYMWENKAQQNKFYYNIKYTKNWGKKSLKMKPERISTRTHALQQRKVSREENNNKKLYHVYYIVYWTRMCVYTVVVMEVTGNQWTKDTDMKTKLAWDANVRASWQKIHTLSQTKQAPETNENDQWYT